MQGKNCRRGKTGQKRRKYNPPLRLPLSFDKAVDGLLAVKLKRRKSR